jgi:hypothetical protein
MGHLGGSKAAPHSLPERTLCRSSYSLFYLFCQLTLLNVCFNPFEYLHHRFCFLSSTIFLLLPRIPYLCAF